MLKAISDTVTPQGVVCTVKMRSNDFDYEGGKRYIALDTIQNPDNLGAISRTAEAFGIDGMVICGGCDIYNPKALRASMGALFRLPIYICQNLEDEIEKQCKVALSKTDIGKVYFYMNEYLLSRISYSEAMEICISLEQATGNELYTDIIAICRDWIDDIDQKLSSFTPTTFS